MTAARAMKVSIIIPTIGRETLNDVLESLFLNNNFDQIMPEIIVIFDGELLSNKLSNAQQEILNRFQDEEMINLIETKKKVYAAGARNLGIEQAAGEVVAFLGDDTIPAKNWLVNLHDWHVQHPHPTEALLGRVHWIEKLAGDPFHKWLERNAQFDYGRLEYKKQAEWQHFYTSNVSVKKALLINNRSKDEKSNLELFSTSFKGWGFEDAEFGYRLAKRGMELYYDKELKVYHDDKQTVAKMVQHTKEARANAIVFESLHPEVKILPRGLKLMILELAIFLTWPWCCIPQIHWWRQWKQAWID